MAIASMNVANGSGPLAATVGTGSMLLKNTGNDDSRYLHSQLHTCFDSHSLQSLAERGMGKGFVQFLQLTY
jgi:hypothetical protein